MRTPEQHFEDFRRHADAAALAAIFDALAPELLLVAAHVAPMASDAEDLVQATFLDAIEKADRWDAGRPLMPWLIGIFVHHARALRRQKARALDATRLHPQHVPSPLDSAADAEVAEHFAAALRSLSRQYRQVLTLRLVHGLLPTAIAHALGCPVATVKTRLQRGLEWLRKLLPPGLAATVAMAVTTGRGLAAVRTAVLAHAGHATTVAASSIVTSLTLAAPTG